MESMKGMGSRERKGRDKGVKGSREGIAGEDWRGLEGKQMGKGKGLERNKAGGMEGEFFDLYRGRYTFETITVDHAAANRCNISDYIGISALFAPLPGMRKQVNTLGLNLWKAARIRPGKNDPL